MLCKLADADGVGLAVRVCGLVSAADVASAEVSAAVPSAVVCWVVGAVELSVDGAAEIQPVRAAALSAAVNRIAIDFFIICFLLELCIRIKAVKCRMGVG